MSKKGGKGVLKRLFSKDDTTEPSSSAAGTATEKKKKKKGSILHKASTIRDSTPPDSPRDDRDQRLSTIFSEGQTHAPTVTRAPTVTDYQPNHGYFDGSSVHGGSDIHIHDPHGGMISPTVLGEPWHGSPEHAHLPLHVPPSRNASVRQAPSAITRHGTVINEHGSLRHAHGVANTASMSGTPYHAPLHDSMGTHKSLRSQHTRQSSSHHDAPIYVHGASHGGHEPIIVNGGSFPSASGNNHYVVDPGGHQRGTSITRQPTVITPANAGETVLKPGDMMEIDPTNPPIFMLDDGVELEIDNGDGFVPYEEFMEDFRRRPAPPPPSTFVVHGAGDVVIQDEHGNHIQTIPGRGAEAGRGQPQHYNSSRSNPFSPHSPRPPEDALSPSWGERPLSYPSAMGGSMPASPRWEDGAPSPGREGTSYGSQEGERDEEDVAHLSILRTPPTISVSRAPSLRRHRSASNVSHHSSGSESSSVSWGRTEADRFSRDFDAKTFRMSQYSLSMSKDWDAEVGNGKRYSRDLDASQAGSRKSLIRKSSFFSGLRPLSQRPDKSISPLFSTLDLPPPPTFVPRVQSPPLDFDQPQSQVQAQLPVPKRRETTGVSAADRKNRVESKYLPSIRHALERKISFGSFASMAKELLPRAANDSQDGVPPLSANPSMSPTSPTSPIEPTPAPPVMKVRTRKLPSPTRPAPTAPAATKTLSINTRKANDAKSQDVRSPGLSVTSPKPSDVAFQPIFQSFAFSSVSPVDPPPPVPSKQGHALRHTGRLKLDAPVQTPSKALAPAVDIFKHKGPEPIVGDPKEAEEAATAARLKKEVEESEQLQRLREEIEANQRAEMEARIKAEVEAKIRREFEERERERQLLREEEAIRIAAELEAAKKSKEIQKLARLDQEAANRRLVAQREAEAKALKEEHERARLEEDRLRKEEEAREAARLHATRVAELERELLKARRQEEMRREEAERERKKREDEERERIQQEKQLAVERAAAQRVVEERRRKEEQEQIERQKHAQEKADLLARLEEEMREREREVILQREEAERREKAIRAELERKKADEVKREAEAREREEEERRVREAELVQIAAEHERRRKEELERLESALRERLEREAEQERRKALQVADQALSTSESLPIPPPLPPPPPPPPYVPLSLSQPARLVTKHAAVLVSADDKCVEASIPPPPPPPPPPYASNRSAQRPTGVLPSSAVQLKPVPRPATLQSPTQGNSSSTPSSAKVEPRERRVSLLDCTKTQVSTVSIQLPTIPAFRTRTTSHVRSNTSPAILSLIEKCAAGANDQGGIFSSGSKALTPTLTGATLATVSGTIHTDGVEFMPSTPSDTTATLTFVPPTPTQPINIEANVNPTDVKNHGHAKYDTASPDVVESTTKDILIETRVTEFSTLTNEFELPPTTSPDPLESPLRAGETSIDRVRSASFSLDILLPETTPTSVTQLHPSTPPIGPAIPPRPASLERRSSQVQRSASILSLRAMFDKPATPDPTRQAAQVQEMGSGASPRKIPPLAPKPKSSIARLSAAFEQQPLVSPRRSIPTPSKSESPPALKFIASLPAPDLSAHSPTSVVDPALEDRVNTLPAKPANASPSPIVGAFTFNPSTSTELVPPKATADPEAVTDLALSSSIEVLNATKPDPAPPKVFELVKAMEASQPTSTELVEKVAPTPPIKFRPILSPKPVSLVRGFSVSRAISGSPDPNHRATFAGTPSPRVHTALDAPVQVTPSRRGSTTGKVGTPPPLAPKPNFMSRPQSTTAPAPPLTSPPPDAKQGSREESATSTTPIRLPVPTHSDKPAPLFPPPPLSASPLPLSSAYRPAAPENHKMSGFPSATALEHKREELKNMEQKHIEAETLRLQDNQQAVMLARLEEDKREQDKITNETVESELKWKLEEKRKTKADTSKPWIKRKPKREEIDPMILASLTSLESRSVTPLPLIERNASTSQRPVSTPVPVDNNIQDSDKPFMPITSPELEWCSSPIVIALDKKNIVVSPEATCEQGDVATPFISRSFSLATPGRGSTTPKAPTPPPIALKPKSLTKAQTTASTPTAPSMHAPASTNERLLENAMSIGSSVAAPVVPDYSPRPSVCQPSSEQNVANNPRLSSAELLAEKMLERERVWSMDAEELEAVATKPADGEDAAERARIGEEKREQERMSFEAAELELRRKQEEKRNLEMEVKPPVEDSKTRKRQSAPLSDLVGRTSSSSKQATQAVVGPASQTRRKGVPASLIVPPPEVLNERAPVDHLPPGTTLGYSFTLLNSSPPRMLEPSPPALSLMRVSEVTVVAQTPSPEDANVNLPSADSRIPTQHGDELSTHQPSTRGSADLRSTIVPPAPSPKPHSLISRRLFSSTPSMESHIRSRPSSRTGIYDFGRSHDPTLATYPSNTPSPEPHTHARKSSEPVLMGKASRSPRPLSPMHTGISVSSPIPIPPDLVTTAHGMPSSLPCLRKLSHPLLEAIAQAVDVPRVSMPYLTDFGPSISPVLSEDSFVTAPTRFVTPTESFADLAMLTARTPSPPPSLAVVLSAAPKFKGIVPQRRASLQDHSPAWITGTLPIPIPWDIEKERKQEREAHVKIELQREKEQRVKEKERGRKSVSFPVPPRNTTTSTFSFQGLIQPSEDLDGISGAIMPRWNDYRSSSFLSSSPSSSSISTSPPTRSSTPLLSSSPSSSHSPRSLPRHAAVATLNPAHLPGGSQHVEPLRRRLTKQLEWDGRKFEVSLPGGRPRERSLIDRSPSPQAMALGNAVRAYISPEVDRKKLLP